MRLNKVVPVAVLLATVGLAGITPRLQAKPARAKDSIRLTVSPVGGKRYLSIEVGDVHLLVEKAIVVYPGEVRATLEPGENDTVRLTGKSGAISAKELTTSLQGGLLGAGERDE